MKMKKIGLLLLAVVVMTLMTGCEIYGSAMEHWMGSGNSLR